MLIEMKKKRPIKPKIYVFINGEKAEYQYFSDFKDYLGQDASGVVKINSKCVGKDPATLITRAITHKNDLETKDNDQIWCVFDIDDFVDGLKKEKNFNQAINLAKTHGIKLAWSNECFELWLLLHFQAVSSQINRNEYDQKLENHFTKINFNYQKNIEGVFENIFNRLSTAINNAKNYPKIILRKTLQQHYPCW